MPKAHQWSPSYVKRTLSVLEFFSFSLLMVTSASFVAFTRSAGFIVFVEPFCPNKNDMVGLGASRGSGRLFDWFSFARASFVRLLVVWVYRLLARVVPGCPDIPRISRRPGWCWPALGLRLRFDAGSFASKGEWLFYYWYHIGYVFV